MVTLKASSFLVFSLSLASTQLLRSCYDRLSGAISPHQLILDVMV